MKTKSVFVGKVMTERYSVSWGELSTRKEFKQFELLFSKDVSFDDLEIGSTIILNNEKLTIEDVLTDVQNDTKTYVTDKIVRVDIDTESLKKIYEHLIKEKKELYEKEFDKRYQVQNELDELKKKKWFRK